MPTADSRRASSARDTGDPTTAEGGQIGNNFSIDGFSARTDIFLDGMRDRGQYYRDTFALEPAVLVEPHRRLRIAGTFRGELAHLEALRVALEGLPTDAPLLYGCGTWQMLNALAAHCYKKGEAPPSLHAAVAQLLRPFPRVVLRATQGEEGTLAERARELARSALTAPQNAPGTV